MPNQSPAPVAGAAMTDAEYLLSLIDETFGSVPENKAHHDRMRKIAASLHPQPAPAVAAEADFEPMKSAWPLDRAADMLTAYAEMVKAMGRYAEEHYIPEVEQVVAELNALAARSAPAVAESQWRTIGSAPKDGTVVDLWLRNERLANCFWDEVCWMQHYAESSTWFSLGGVDPTHWMPLPAPPTVGSGSAQEGQAK